MYTIVVADDEEQLRKAIIRKVNWERCGFIVVGEAENGIEAIELVEKLEPDLLLTDIRMPFVSGIELARQVREIRPSTHIAFLSGFDKFSYAQQAIQYNIISYMVKPISMNELENELVTIKNKIDARFTEFISKNSSESDRCSFVMALLLDSFQVNGGEELEASVAKQAIECNFLKENSKEIQYTVITTSVVDENGNNCTTRDMVNSIDTILKKYVYYQSFYSSGRIVSLLYGTKGMFRKYLHILVDEIIQSTKRIRGLRCSIGVSRSVEKLTQCHEAYKEAVNAISYGDLEEGGVHYIADEEHGEEINPEDMRDTISEIEQLIRSGTKEELQEKLKRLFQSFRENQLSQATANFMLMQLLVEVCQIVYTVSDSRNLQELQNDELFRRMTFYEGSIKETENKFIRFCMDARSTIMDQRKKSSTLLCEQTNAIIENEYDNPDMSLVSISNRLNVSPNYLSALLKKETGFTFIDLLTKRRMEAARQLLLCSSMKIREISERCGYNDQHYFSYCFKKSAGISPNALRRENLVEV